MRDIAKKRKKGGRKKSASEISSPRITSFGMRSWNHNSNKGMDTGRDCVPLCPLSSSSEEPFIVVRITLEKNKKQKDVPFARSLAR